MRRSTVLALPIALSLVAGCAHHHHHDYDDDQVTVVRVDDLPPDVREHFYRDHPDCDVREVRVIHVGGEEHYHFRFNDHGHDHETEYRHGGDEIHSEYR